MGFDGPGLRNNFAGCGGRATTQADAATATCSWQQPTEKTYSSTGDPMLSTQSDAPRRTPTPGLTRTGPATPHTPTPATRLTARHGNPGPEDTKLPREPSSPGQEAAGAGCRLPPLQLRAPVHRGAPAA